MSLSYPDLVVNGEHVPSERIAAEIQHHPAPRGEPEVAWRQASRALAMRTLLLQEARRRGLAGEAMRVGASQYEIEDEALIRELLEVAVCVDKPSDKAVREEWEKNPGRYRAPPLWEVSHILVACDANDEKLRQQALGRARELTKELSSHPERFAHLAREHSDCDSRAAGGVLGQLGPGDTLQAFEAALRRLDEGEITHEPVLTHHGWHVIRLDAVAEGNVLPFESVRDKLATAMEKADWARAARKFAEQLIDAAEIQGMNFERDDILESRT